MPQFYHLLIEGHSLVVYSFLYIKTELLWIIMYVFYVDISFHFSRMLRSTMIKFYGKCIINFQKNWWTTLEWLYHVIFPPAMYERSSFSAFSPAIDVIIFPSSAPTESVISYWGFYLYFSYGSATDILNVFICHLLSWNICPHFLPFLSEFFMYSRYKFFFRQVNCRFFSQSVACLFKLLTGFCVVLFFVFVYFFAEQ